MTNHTYTADDFATAEFAKRGQFEFARRVDDTHTPWLAYWEGASEWGTDSGMAADGWVPVREATPVSLDTLRTAWENAEQANGCRKGDVLIIQEDEDNYAARRMDHGSYLYSTARILSRAQRREPWADLADDLKRFDWDMTPHVAAQEMYEAGWRKTGGDEK